MCVGTEGAILSGCGARVVHAVVVCAHAYHRGPCRRTPEMVEAEKKKRAADARKRNFLGGVFGRKKGAGKPSPVPLSAAEETSTHVEINKAQQFSQATQATGEDYDGRRARRERLQTVSTGAPSAARVPRGAAANAHVASTNRFTRTQSMSAQRTSRNPDVAKNQAGDLAVAAPSKQRFARMKEVGGMRGGCGASRVPC